jgi:ubiquinone/menaquinone biosynthesis C-methylase UbiE
MLVKQLLFGYYDTQCVYSITHYRVADHLQQGPKSSKELADSCGIESQKLFRVMRYLSHRGLFDFDGDDRFSLNQHSRYLVSSHPENYSHFVQLHAHYFYPAAMKLVDSLNVSTPAFKLEFGKNAGQYFRDNPRAGAIYNQAMRENSELLGRLITDLFDFSKYKTIVDVGGGVGSLLAHILLKNKTCCGVNMDQSSVASTSQQYFEERGLASRAEFISGDFNLSVPGNGDLYLIKAVLHAREDADVLQILSQIKRVLPQGGKLLVIERFIPINPTQECDAFVNDINMLNVTTGTVRTQQAYEALFTQAGFAVKRTQTVIDAMALFELECAV